MIIFIFIVFGLVIGSFLNVVIFRFAADESGIIAGRSHCVSCNHELSWHDNIPVVSYIALRGKCRYCRQKISIQYPLVEALTACIFGVVGVVAAQSGLQGVALVVGVLNAGIFAAMIVVFVYDLKYMEVPMIAIYVAIALAISVMLMKDVNTSFGSESGSIFQSTLFLHSIAGVVCFAFFFGLSFVSGETWMGYGDGFIALVIGLFLGPMASFIAIMIAVTAGALIGSLMMLMQGKTLKTAIPFGPYLVGGMFTSYVLVHFYPDTMSILW